MMIRLTPNGRVGQGLGGADLGGELVRLHGAAGEHAEAAGVRERRDQPVLRDPGHGAAHERERTAEELGPGAATAARGGAGRGRPWLQAPSRP